MEADAKDRAAHAERSKGLVHEMKSEKRVPPYVEILSIYLTAFGIIYIVVAIIATSIPHVALGTLIAVIGLFLLFSLHSAHVVNKSDNILKLQTKKGMIILDSSDILWAMKMVRFTFSDRFWVMLKTKRHNGDLPRYYMLQNTRSLDLIGLFRSMGVRVKNVP